MLGRLARQRTTTRTFSTSTIRHMTLAKPADSLKSAKILGKEELKDAKWIHLEGIKWQKPDGTEVIL